MCRHTDIPYDKHVNDLKGRVKLQFSPDIVDICAYNTDEVWYLMSVYRHGGTDSGVTDERALLSSIRPRVSFQQI